MGTSGTIQKSIKDFNLSNVRLGMVGPQRRSVPFSSTPSHMGRVKVARALADLSCPAVPVPLFCVRDMRVRQRHWKRSIKGCKVP